MAKSKKPQKPWHEPSDKEKCQKVDQAIAALEAGMEYFQIIAEKHTQLAFDFLGIKTTEDLADWALTFLYEIKETDPIQCFVGKMPNAAQKKVTKIFFFFLTKSNPNILTKWFI